MLATSAVDAGASLFCAWWVSQGPSEWVVMVVTMVKRADGSGETCGGERNGGDGDNGGDHVINSLSSRSPPWQQMMVHSFFVPG